MAVKARASLCVCSITMMESFRRFWSVQTHSRMMWSNLRNKIDAELLTDGQLCVRRQVLFSSVPANGYFRYKDRFQIIPVPQEAPRPGQFVGQHPFILEYAVRTSPDFMITSFRQRKLAREVELVLSTLLYLHVFSLGSEARKHWVIDYQNDEVALPSKFLQEGYAWHGSVADAADFSATKGTQPMASLPIDQYYGRPGLSVDSFLDVPANLTQQLDKFYALNTVDCDKFLRASYWFQHANTVFTHSKSASFVALVSAIEAIMPEREGDTRCPECNSHIGPSITKRFVDLVESLIPDSGISQKRPEALLLDAVCSCSWREIVSGRPQCVEFHAEGARRRFRRPECVAHC